jgi:ABC-type branched-subunit amino acid transport system ATPase component
VAISLDEQGGSSDATEARRILDISGVTVRFGGIVALNGVSFQADAGEVLGIIGPNGAGKTTLFDVISGVRAPNDGRIVVDGDDLTNKSATDRARRGLKRTFQRVQTFGWLTVEENVLTALEWRGGGGGLLADLVAFPTRRRREKERRERTEHVLEQCGLLPVRDELAGSLPIGVARMVEFARAVVDPPKLLLLDEPASGLDETEEVRLGDQIQAVRAETGCVVLLVEHNAGFVMEQCDRIVVLDLGSVIATGSPSEIQQNQAVRDAYLGEADLSAHTSHASHAEAPVADAPADAPPDAPPEAPPPPPGDVTPTTNGDAPTADSGDAPTTI